MSEQIEDRARRQGWVPIEDFRGDPDKWRSAEEFVEIGDNLMPVMRERLDSLEKKYDVQTGELKKAVKGLGKLAEHHRGTRRRAVASAKRELKSEMRAAVRAGDVENYDRLAAQEEGLEVEEATATSVQTPEFQEWVKENEWYNNDPVLSNYADQLGPHLSAQAADNEEFYDLIRQKVQAAYPTHSAFQIDGEPKSKKEPLVPVASVEGGGLGGGGEPKDNDKKTWNDLPKEAQETYNREFSEMSDYFSKEDYAAGYFDPSNKGE